MSEISNLLLALAALFSAISTVIGVFNSFHISEVRHATNGMKKELETVAFKAGEKAEHDRANV